MKVKATVIFDVEHVDEYEEAYHRVFSLVHGPIIHKYVRGKYYAAYLDKVISVEAATKEKDESI